MPVNPIVAAVGLGLLAAVRSVRSEAWWVAWWAEFSAGDAFPVAELSFGLVGDWPGARPLAVRARHGVDRARRDPYRSSAVRRAEAGGISFAHQPYFLTNRLRVSAQGLSGASLVYEFANDQGGRECGAACHVGL